MSNTISILGSGWLGLPLAKHLVSIGNRVKASTTSRNRMTELEACGLEPFLIDLGRLEKNIGEFLETDILIINIPSKNIDGFSALLGEIEKSRLKNLLFVSSTSVYDDTNKTIREADGEEVAVVPLTAIENLFRNCGQLKTTIVRFGGLIGFSRHPGRFFAGGRRVSKPDSYVNLIHGDDCIGIISQILQQEVWGEVFNCCADTHPTKREFYTQAAQSIGLPPPQFDEPGAASFKIISNEKVKRVLKYEFVHPDLMKITF